MSGQRFSGLSGDVGQNPVVTELKPSLPKGQWPVGK